MDQNINSAEIIFALAIGIIVALFVGLLWKFLGAGSKKGAIAILGLSDSGKTQLFSRLCHGVDALSVTSTKESKGYFTSNSSGNTVIYDVPGHDRIRYGLFDKVKQHVGAIIFLVDASTFQEDVRDVAEFLYTILCDGVVQKQKPQLLVACNKQDILTSKGAALIKSSLEEEINLLRVTKSSQLKSVGEGYNNNFFLGLRENDFKFEHLKSFRVSFVECIGAKGAKVEEVTKWIQTII